MESETRRKTQYVPYRSFLALAACHGWNQASTESIGPILVLEVHRVNSTELSTQSYWEVGRGIGTYEAYKALLKMQPSVYIHGEKVDRSADRIDGGRYVMKQTFDMANDPESAGVCTAKSHLTGKTINPSRTSASPRRTCWPSR